MRPGFVINSLREILAEQYKSGADNCDLVTHAGILLGCMVPCWLT